MGQAPALHDTINVRYPQLSTLAARAVSQRWVFDEFNHEQSRLDLLSCPKNIYDVMLMNLAYQWEADSVAARAIAPIFAPFVTNSELWELLLENTNMEVTHAKTYSEIVRQCVPNPNDVFAMVMQNEQTLKRAETVNRAFDGLVHAGALKTFKDMGMQGYSALGDQMFYNSVFVAVAALYFLERIQFMASFAATFAIVEQGYFQSIGTAVQKIMLDEIGVHAETDVAILRIEMATPAGQRAMKEVGSYIRDMLIEVVEAEMDWAPYLLSNGRSIVGLTVPLLQDWVLYNAQPVFDQFGFDNPFKRITSNPLPWMTTWIDIDKRQNAQQEADGNNYALNVVKDDLGDEELAF